MSRTDIYKVAVTTILCLWEVIWAWVMTRHDLDRDGVITTFAVAITMLMAIVGMWV